MKKILLACLLPFSLHSIYFTKQSPITTNPKGIDLLAKQIWTRSDRRKVNDFLYAINHLYHNPNVKISRSGTKKLANIAGPIFNKVKPQSL